MSHVHNVTNSDIADLEHGRSTHSTYMCSILIATPWHRCRVINLDYISGTGARERTRLALFLSSVVSCTLGTVCGSWGIILCIGLVRWVGLHTIHTLIKMCTRSGATHCTTYYLLFSGACAVWTPVAPGGLRGEILRSQHCQWILDSDSLHGFRLWVSFQNFTDRIGRDFTTPSMRRLGFP